MQVEKEELAEHIKSVIRKLAEEFSDNEETLKHLCSVDTLIFAYELINTSRTAIALIDYRGRNVELCDYVDIVKNEIDITSKVLNEEKTQ